MLKKNKKEVNEDPNKHNIESNSVSPIQQTNLTIL